MVYDEDEDEKGSEVSAQVEIVLKKKFKDKIDYLSTYYNKEIGGFFTGEINKKEGRIIIDDLLIPKQEVGCAHVDFCPKDLVGMRKEYGDKCIRILGEWHSHCGMGTFWSSTDDEEMNKKFSEARDISIFMVSSKGEHKIQMIIKNPFNITLDNLPYSIEVDTDIENEMKKEIESKITETTYASKGYNYTTIEEYDFNEKKLKKEIALRFRYYNKTNVVVIDKVLHHWAKRIEEEFKVLKPEVAVLDGENSSVKVILDSKDKSKEFMVDAKAFLFAEIMKIRKDEVIKAKTKATLEEEYYLHNGEDFDEYEDYVNRTGKFPTWRNNFGEEDGYNCSYNGRFR